MQPAPKSVPSIVVQQKLNMNSACIRLQRDDDDETIFSRRFSWFCGFVLRLV